MGMGNAERDREQYRLEVTLGRAVTDAREHGVSEVDIVDALRHTIFLTKLTGRSREPVVPAP